MEIVLLILGSLFLSILAFLGHVYIEYTLIKKYLSKFKLEDVVIIAILSFIPIVNLFMLFSLIFRTWSVFDLNNIITELIRKEK